MIVSARNMMIQIRQAEEWGRKAEALAIKHGATIIHDEVLFETEEQSAAFFKELAEL